jgi:DNA repair protein RadC
MNKMQNNMNQQPRERLLRCGEGALAPAELLALLIGTGVRGQDALGLATTIMMKFRSFRNMADTSILQWKEFKGIGAVKLARIRAALEIGRRFQEEEAHKRCERIMSSNDAALLMMPRLRDRKREIFEVLFLDANHRLIVIHESTQGTVDHASPILREIFQKAIEHFAVSLICVHNHPSGNSAPSAEDKCFTKELIAAGAVLRINVLDHIIIADSHYFSFADEGLI